jgi:hypothetical protein
MTFDFIDLGKLRRGILYAALLLLFLGFQDLLFSHVTVLGVRSMFVPALVVAVGLFEGGVWGGVFGLFAGLLGDWSFAENTVLFTVLYPVLGFFSGMLAQFVVNRRFFSYFLLSLAALALTAFCQMFRLLFVSGAHYTALLQTAGLQTLWSLPFTVPAYLACKTLNRHHFD